MSFRVRVLTSTCLNFLVYKMELIIIMLTPSSKTLNQWSPTILAPGTGFMEDNFSMDQGRVEAGWLKHITFIVHFISIIITSAAPHHQALDPRGGDPCIKQILVVLSARSLSLHFISYTVFVSTSSVSRCDVYVVRVISPIQPPTMASWRDKGKNWRHLPTGLEWGRGPEKHAGSPPETSHHLPTCGEGNGTPLQSSCLENPWTEEPGRLQSMGSRRVGHNWATSLSLFTFMHWRRKWQPTPVFFPGESQGRGSLVGCRLWSRTESDTTEATEAT